MQTETGVVRRNRKHLLRVPRDERERCNEENEEVPQNTPEPMVLNNQSPDCESPVESTSTEPTSRSIPDNSKGTRARS